MMSKTDDSSIVSPSGIGITELPVTRQGIIFTRSVSDNLDVFG